MIISQRAVVQSCSTARLLMLDAAERSYDRQAHSLSFATGSAMRRHVMWLDTDTLLLVASIPPSRPSGAAASDILQAVDSATAAVTSGATRNWRPYCTASDCDPGQSLTSSLACCRGPAARGAERAAGALCLSQWLCSATVAAAGRAAPDLAGSQIGTVRRQQLPMPMPLHGACATQHGRCAWHTSGKITHEQKDAFVGLDRPSHISILCITALANGSVATGPGQALAVGLSQGGKLFWGPQQIATGSVTSFAVTLRIGA